MNPLNHVAIIMDGNGRWGIKYKNSRNLGHKAGIETVKKIIKSCLLNDIKYLTLFAFSTENWKRPKEEISYLFNLLEIFLLKNIKKFKKKNIKLNFIGKKLASNKLNTLIKEAQIKTKLNKKLQINLALNYGSRDEIVESLKKMNKQKLLINEKNVNLNLFTKNIPDPEILIRTGNVKRISNFLLWQISYTEIFFVKKLWPEFNEKDFMRIIKNFKNIKRNFGSL